jgi:RND family efflux transporter MFP subunit
MRRKTMILSATVLTAVIGVGSAAAVGLGSAPANKSEPRQGPQLVQVVTTKPSTGALRAFTGVIAARVQSNLGFRVPGKVVERLVDIGQTVHAGDPLMRLDQTDLDLARTAKENAVVAARAAAEQAAADEARYRKLRANGWATQQRYEQALALRDSTAAQLAAAEAQAEVARNEAAYSILRADADGTVMETLAEPGQVVSAGQTVVKLARAGSREAVVYLPETMRPAIGSKTQARTYGTFTAASGAVLRQLSDAADPATRTYEARYVLDGEASRAPLGATVTVWVPKGEVAETLEVPLGALYDDGKTTSVWVVDTDSNVARRAVQVRQLGDETALVTGLNAGERIVALGAHLIRENQRVLVAEQRMASKW